MDCQPAERQDHFLYTSDGYVKSAVVHEDRDVGRLTRRDLAVHGHVVVGVDLRQCLMIMIVKG